MFVCECVLSTILLNGFQRNSMLQLYTASFRENFMSVCAGSLLPLPYMKTEICLLNSPKRVAVKKHVQIM